jgi:hypothetical protein
VAALSLVVALAAACGEDDEPAAGGGGSAGGGTGGSAGSTGTGGVGGAGTGGTAGTGGSGAAGNAGTGGTTAGTGGSAAGAGGTAAGNAGTAGNGGTAAGSAGGAGTAGVSGSAGTGGAGECNALSLDDAPQAPEVAGEGAFPTPAGGAIADGTYLLTKFVIYPPHSVDPFLRKEKLVIASGSVEEAREYPTESARLSATFQTRGAQLVLSGTCPQEGTFSIAYTAPDDKTLWLFDAEDAEYHVYEKQLSTSATEVQQGRRWPRGRW